MEFYVVDLSSIGVKRKVVSIDGYSWEIIHGQTMKKNKVVELYPQFFKAKGEEIGETPAQEFEAPVETVVVTQPEVIDAVVATPVSEEAPVETVTEEAPTETVTEEAPVETVTEEVEETPAEVEALVTEEVEETPAEVEALVENVTDTLDVAAVLAEAEKIETKNALEAYGRTFGVELNKQKSLKNMIKELEEKLKA